MNRSLKVGAFVLVGVILAGAIVFLIGDNRNFWSPKVTFKAAFGDVGGMKPGSPVRMGGVDIGAVTSVGHSSNADDPRIVVTFAVVRAEAGRLRQGVPQPDGTIKSATVARVGNRGFLGDKMLELSTDGSGPAVAVGGLVAVEEAADPLAQLSSLGRKAETVLKNLEEGTKPLSDPELVADFKSSVKSLSVLLSRASQNDSIVQRLTASPKDAERFSQALDNLAVTSESLRAFGTRLNQGPGLAHTLVYDAEVAGHAAGSVAEVHQNLKAIREGKGLLHALIYSEADTKHAMANIDAMSDDLRAIVGDVRKGRGTLGALVVDPSLYEDLKSLVGNMDRNQVLRALVRYSIRADESRPNPQVKGK